MASPQCKSRIQLPPFQSQTFQLSEIVSYSPLFTASLHEIDKLISNYQETFTSLPRSSHRRSALLGKLADLQYERFRSSHEERDLDASILQYTHAIFLPFPHPTEYRQDTTVTAVFMHLSMYLTLRSLESKQPSDIIYSAKYLRYIRDRSLQVEAFDITPFTRNVVTTSLVLVCALAPQMGLEHGDAMRGIEEMSVLCRELLYSDASENVPHAALESFAEAVIAHLKDTLVQPSQQVIECLCEANTRLPDSHSISMALSFSFILRFDMTKSNDDYECAMGHLDKSIASHSPVGSPSKTLGQYLGLAASLAALRSVYYNRPEHLEEAICRTRARLGLVSVEDPERGEITETLARFVRRRAMEFGDTGVPKGHRDDPAVDDLPSFSRLAASLAGSNAVKAPSMTTKACYGHLEAIASACRITDKAEIDRAVQYCRLLRPSLQ